MKVEGPERSGLLPPPQVTEVSGHPGPVATTVPPQVLPDSTEVVGVVYGEVPPVGVPPVGVPPVGVLPSVTEVVDIVPGEVPPVGGLPDSMQVGVNSGEVPPGDNVLGPIQVGLGHSEVPPVGDTPVGGVPERLAPGARHAGRESVVPPRASGMHPPYNLCLSPRVTFIGDSII